VAKKGSGIGMFVSKQIMKWLGGNLTVESGARAPERTVFRAEVKVDCVKERE
jgi:signal transduction histidine kinase